MRKICIVFFLVAGLANALPQDFGDARVNKLYQAILDEGFYNEKQALGTQLGKMKTGPARNALLKLLEADSYWDRTAAVCGLFALNDPSVRDALLDTMFADHMVADEIGKRFSGGLAAHFDFLAARYGQTPQRERRERLLDLVCRPDFTPGSRLLRDIVADEASPDRTFAFKKLIAVYKGNYELAKKYLRDRELREYALACVLAEGSPEDLPLFTEILEGKEAPARQILAYQAVDTWAAPGTKRAVFLKALDEKDEILVRAGILVFKNLFDDRIMDRLARLVKTSAFQETRLAAAQRLAGSGSVAVAPYVIPVFKERYIGPSSHTVIDFFAALFTLGVSTLLDGLDRDLSRESFKRRIDGINAALQKTTGAHLPPSYAAWADWAVYSGYAVDGANIVQYLFSSYPAKRTRAVDQAAKLLGYRDRKDFSARNNLPETTGERALALALAGQLIDKGFLRDDLTPPGD